MGELKWPEDLRTCSDNQLRELQAQADSLEFEARLVLRERGASGSSREQALQRVGERLFGARPKLDKWAVVLAVVVAAAIVGQPLVRSCGEASADAVHP